MRKTSIAHLSALDASPEELVKIAARCGYDYIGLRLLPVTPDEAASPLISNATRRRDLVARATDLGVGILDVELIKLTPSTIVSALEPAFATARELGARHALTQVHDLSLEQATPLFAETCDLAATYGLTCDVEFLSWTDMRDLSTVQRLLSDAGRVNAGICVDTLHFWRSGCRASEIERLPKSWLHFAQVADALGPREATREDMIRVAREDREMPGDGVVDLAGIIARLPADAPLSIEIPNTQLARRLTHEARMCVAKAKLIKVLSKIEAQAA